MKNYNEIFGKIITGNEENTNTLDIKNDGTCAIVVVDMINDFVFTSAMANPLAEKIIPKIADVLKNFIKDDIGTKVVHLNESHTEESIEFNSYPIHGVRGTKGAEVVDMLKEFPCEKVIFKNSTNGFHIEEFKNWLNDNKDLEKIVVVGVCADICVLQFALSLKTYLNQINKPFDVIIPRELVETYDAPNHDRDVFYHMALELASQAGCKIVKNVNVVI